MAEDMYKQQLMDRFHDLKYRRNLERVSVDSTASNTLCGDIIRFQLALNEQKEIVEVGWSGDGCAICLVSTDLLAEHLEGKRVIEAQELSEVDIVEKLGIELKPSRIKCATLGLEAVQKGLRQA